MNDMHDVSKASVCTAVHEVMVGVNTMLLPLWIHWPRNMTKWRASFMIWGRMPLVCGCIDRTVIEIDAQLCTLTYFQIVYQMI
jgi:hypothetical protein